MLNRRLFAGVALGASLLLAGCCHKCGSRSCCRPAVVAASPVCPCPDPCGCPAPAPACGCPAPAPAPVPVPAYAPPAPCCTSLKK